MFCATVSTRTSAVPSRQLCATALAGVGVETFEPSASVIVVAMLLLSAARAKACPGAPAARHPSDGGAALRLLAAEQVQQRQEDVDDRDEDPGRQPDGVRLG